MNNSAIVSVPIFGAALALACGGPTSPQDEDLGLAASACSVEAKPMRAKTRLFVPSPREEATTQIRNLAKAGQFVHAASVRPLQHR